VGGDGGDSLERGDQRAAVPATQREDAGDRGHLRVFGLDPNAHSSPKKE
jgi:hypothetical protein